MSLNLSETFKFKTIRKVIVNEWVNSKYIM